MKSMLKSILNVHGASDNICPVANALVPPGLTATFTNLKFNVL